MLEPNPYEPPTSDRSDNQPFDANQSFSAPTLFGRRIPPLVLLIAVGCYALQAIDMLKWGPMEDQFHGDQSKTLNNSVGYQYDIVTLEIMRSKL